MSSFWLWYYFRMKDDEKGGSQLNENSSDKKQDFDFKKAVDGILSKYEKTFKDLARYDQGEPFTPDKK